MIERYSPRTKPGPRSPAYRHEVRVVSRSVAGFLLKLNEELRHEPPAEPMSEMTACSTSFLRIASI
jgi:hypothetical protein